MSEYKELIRQFDKIRSYVRDFYVYGFKTREDFHDKSGRTYDNHRRRMESWFSDYICTDQKGHKKFVFLTMDSGRMAVNPLYQVWKSKTFTDNDILLRFFVPDLLADGQPRSLEAIADEIQDKYQCLLDTQTLRRKLTAWEKEGLIVRKKAGKQFLYSQAQPVSWSCPGMPKALSLAAAFFQGAAPFGFIGSTILDFWNERNDWFRFRSDYLVHTLEDEILLPLLTAIEQRSMIRMTVRGTKRHRITSVCATPLRILTSTQTGRRYVCAMRPDSRRLATFRLDSIEAVKILGEDPCFEQHRKKLQDTLPYVWGVSFGSSQKPEKVSMEIVLDEKTEPYILSRLEREGRGGSLKRLEPGVYEYTRLCLDGAELLSWVKTFTGRIRSFSCTNRSVSQRLLDDMNLMKSRYLSSEEEPVYEDS